MNKFIILDIETQDYDITSGIYEVSALAIENYEVKDTLHLGIIEDESLISRGFGYGYEEISYNNDCIREFKNFIEKYNYPIVAHNVNFDKKFLIHYNWINEDYEFYDSIRAIKYENPNLFSYALGYLVDFYEINMEQKHNAVDDTYLLLEVLKLLKPKTWIPTGKTKEKVKKSKSYTLETINLDEIEVTGDLFKDKNIVFTGKGPYARKYLSILAIKQGATILNGVTKKTDILVVGEDAGSKLQKANELGIEILNIDDFMDLVDSNDINNIIDSNKFFTKIIINKDNENNIDKYLIGQTISLIPMRVKMAEKISKIILKLGGNPIKSFRQKETSLLIFEKYGEDFVTVEKAKQKGIKVLPLHIFNRLLLENKLKEYLS